MQNKNEAGELWGAVLGNVAVGLIVVTGHNVWTYSQVQDPSCPIYQTGRIVSFPIGERAYKFWVV